MFNLKIFKIDVNVKNLKNYRIFFGIVLYFILFVKSDKFWYYYILYYYVFFLCIIGYMCVNNMVVSFFGFKISFFII